MTTTIATYLSVFINVPAPPAFVRVTNTQQYVAYKKRQAKEVFPVSHMLRKRAKEMVGKHVVVYHVEGWACHGVLHTLTHDGVYLMNAQMINHVSASDEKPFLEHTIAHNTNVDASQAFFPFFFLPFAALAGIAVASAVRPPYYYGYGGYPGAYGGYGYGPYPGYW